MAILNLFSAESQQIIDAIASSGTVAIASNVAKTGTYSLRANPTTTGVGYAEFGGYDNAAGEVLAAFSSTATFVSFDLYITTLPGALQEPILSIHRSGGTRQLNVSVQSDGTLQCVDIGSSTFDGTAVLSTATWYHVEISYNRSTGAFVLKIDGVSDIATTISSDSVITGRVRFGKILNENGQTVDFNYDNIVIDDATWHADAEVMALTVAGNGTDTGWAAGTGLSDFSEVDIPANFSTRVRSNTAATDDDITFNMDALAGAGVSGTIYGIMFLAAMEKGSTGSTPTFQFRTRSGSAFNGGNVTVPYASSRRYGRILENDPNTAAAWTVANLDAAEFGLRKPAASSIDADCELFFVEVAFKPAGGAPAAIPIELHRRAGNTLLRM